MCGIAGLINYTHRPREHSIANLREMANSLAHRGPDADGIWLDDDGRVGLCHRRLSIIDLSSTGAQPMQSASGRYCIVYNGEIYGFLGLRAELAASGSRFKGHSDTEVLLEAIEAYGLERALERCNGMFAFALYDKATRQVIFARDRIGKKPLYIGIAQDAVVFGSELKSLRKHPSFASPEIDRDALTLYVRHSYVPTPYSIYRNVLKLPPGTWVALSLDGQPASADALLQSVTSYWDAFDAVEQGCARRINCADEGLRLLDEMLHRAVSERIVSDVPVGVLLSGGIDSSLVTAIMQECSPSPVKSYSIRFMEKQYNEADIAAEIARHLRTDHTELTADASVAMDMVSSLPEVYDEPFAEFRKSHLCSSPNWPEEPLPSLCPETAGDEFFGGYKRYQQMLIFDRLARRTPNFALQAAKITPVWLLELMLWISRRALPPTIREEATGSRVKRLAELLQIPDQDGRYLNFLSQWSHPSEIVLGGCERPTGMSCKHVPAALGTVDRMMYRDMISYLPDDILVKMDRASMAFSLELRAPLLDYHFIELAWRMPRALCFAEGQGKPALRKLLSSRLPEKFINLPKRGFGVPINAWLRGPLRSWADDMLSPARLHRDGIFAPRPIEARWKEHLSGSRDWGPQLWTILMFNAWHDRWAH